MAVAERKEGGAHEVSRVSRRGGGTNAPFPARRPVSGGAPDVTASGARLFLSVWVGGVSRWCPPTGSPGTSVLMERCCRMGVMGALCSLLVLLFFVSGQQWRWLRASAKLPQGLCPPMRGRCLSLLLLSYLHVLSNLNSLLRLGIEILYLFCVNTTFEFFSESGWYAFSLLDPRFPA